MTKGKYIVIEGPEGVGKSTQLQELSKRLQAAGLPVRMLREPDSQSDLTARAIRQLTQDPRYPMNTRTEVLLYNAARAQSLQVIKQSVEHGVICLVDRNYLTTLAIQYYGRGDVPDYQTINAIISFAVGDMEPDLCILLDAPVNVLQERLHSRYNGERFDNLSAEFLERVRAGYLWEAHQRNLPVIFATDTTEQVADNIWKVVSSTLAVREKASNTGTTETTVPTSVKDIIEHKKLADNHSTDQESSAPSDLVEAVIQGVTYLLAPSLISYPLSGSLQTATNEERYYTPDSLNGEVRAQYQQGLNIIYETYDELSQKLQQHLQDTVGVQEQVADILRSVLPLAHMVTISLTSHRTDMDELISNLLSQDLPEAKSIGESFRQQGYSSEQLMPANPAKLQHLAAEHLPDNYAQITEKVSLVDFWPKNELLLVPDMLYSASNQSLDRLLTEINSWPYDRKSQLFKAYIGNRQNLQQRPGKALEKSHYSWDLVSDYGSFLDIQSRLHAEDLNWQAATPRYGYDTPKLIEDAGQTDLYEKCFETSLKLHSYLQKSGHMLESQYATLVGHQIRWKATYNAREAYRLLQTPYSNPLTAALATQMREKLAEVHPLTAENLPSGS